MHFELCCVFCISFSYSVVWPWVLFVEMKIECKFDIFIRNAIKIAFIVHCWALVIPSNLNGLKPHWSTNPMHFIFWILNPCPCSVDRIYYILNINHSICAHISNHLEMHQSRRLFQGFRIMQFLHVSLLFKRKCDLLVKFQYCNLCGW